MNTKIRIAMLLTVLLGLFTVQADEKSKTLLDGLTRTLNGYTSYEITFRASMLGEFDDLPGKIVVSGERYFMSMNEMEVYFDGKIRQTYTMPLQEVVIENPDASDNSLLANPARFFQLYDTDFSHRFIATQSYRGKTVDIVSLSPKTRNLGYADLLLTLDHKTHLPVAIMYQMENGQVIDIDVDQFTPNVKTADSDFTFNPSKHPNVEVIDFR